MACGTDSANSALSSLPSVVCDCVDSDPQLFCLFSLAVVPHTHRVGRTEVAVLVIGVGRFSLLDMKAKPSLDMKDRGLSACLFVLICRLARVYFGEHVRLSICLSVYQFLCFMQASVPHDVTIVD